MPSPDKQTLRKRIWKLLERRHVTRFPFPATGRIPNFQGAEQAAARAAALPEWQRARRLKCNPDAPQRALRLRALREGKIVFMAVPRLADERCFLRLDPARLGRRLTQAATIKGAARLGEPVTPEELGVHRSHRGGQRSRERTGRSRGQGRRLQRFGIRARPRSTSRERADDGSHHGARPSGVER